MHPLDFQAPVSVDETLGLLERFGPEATLMAGGQSLMILLRQGLVAPRVLVSLKRVRELRAMTADGDTLSLGSMLAYHTAAGDQQIAAWAPIARAAAASVGSVHIRNLGTLGGGVCHADPAGDVPTALLALDATLHTVRPGGGRVGEGGVAGLRGRIASATAGLMIVGLFPPSDEGERRDGRDERCPAADRLLHDERADALRETVAGWPSSSGR
jgi:CO/xanthine dehydrogenase FAD-binding subunit